ncbi:MAG: MFS transporter [Rhodanobacter sp.]
MHKHVAVPTGLADPLVGDRPPAMPRWLRTTLILLSVAVFINYIDRGNLATAAALIQADFGLSATRLGFLLTAFFITYVPMQILVGWLADRFGAGRVLLGGFTLWSVSMSLTGVVHSFALLVVLRLLLGLGESVFFPATANILARNFSESQRGFANAVVATGYTAGPAFGIFFGGLLIAGFGWRTFFVGFGLVSLLWLIPWLALAHPQLSQQRATRTGPAPGMRAILRQRSLWGTSAGLFCNNYVWYFTLSWIPYYLVHERHWSIVQMARIGGCAYLLMVLTVLASGWLSDRWIAAGSSPTRVRKSLIGASALLVAICIVGCALARVDASVVWLMLAPDSPCVASSLGQMA